MELWKLEEECLAAGAARVCGADEAGAGPLAGPVYAAAVILPRGWCPEGLNDSKQLNAARRDAFYDRITAEAGAWAVASVPPEEIDEIDILNARMKALDLAIRALRPQADFALVDGDKDHGRRCAIQLPHRTIIKGDSLSASIAAASILAKVSRDRYMVEQDAHYPGYGFAKHKGYPTKAHYQALDELGPCALHRQSFLVKWRAKRG